MREEIKAMEHRIRELVVNDYFSPNIKAEVILDTMLTPYMAEILRDQYKEFKGELCLVTKEMSVMEQGKTPDKYGNMGKKVDYVLADEKAVYLVELKTTNSSIRRKQVESYLENCCGKNFGQVFGTHLLSILNGAFTGKKFSQKFGTVLNSQNWNDDTLREAFYLILEHFGKNCIPEFSSTDDGSGRNAKAARNLIREAGWAQKTGNRSRKYLYTAGQILDYLDEQHGRTLWDKDLKLFYLTPEGKCPSGEFGRCEDFYVGSISLKKAGGYLEKLPDQKLARLLAEIINDIYPGKNQSSD